MPEQKVDKKVLTGQVTGARSSDSYIARDLQERRDEYFATGGKRLTVDPVGQSNLPEQAEILKPGSITSLHAQTVEDDPGQTRGVINYNNFHNNASGVGRNIVVDRQKRKAA